MIDRDVIETIALVALFIIDYHPPTVSPLQGL